MKVSQQISFKMHQAVWTSPILLATFCLIHGAPQKDYISRLPGLSWVPNFKQYSGYLSGSEGKQLHYWFVESSDNPEKDPLVLWMNGGPGCSSLEGFFSEHGPYKVDSGGEILHQHPFAWNKLANMIYLEAPAGVGFSYSEDKNYTTNDNETTESNYLALQDFFRKFPEFSKNDFYITGESYGGFYVPTLVSRVLDDPTINLKGFAVGNPLSDIDMNNNSLIYFAYYHGLLGQEQWNTLLNACCPGHPSSLSCTFTDGKNSSNCSKELNDVTYLVWMSGLNAYNLYDDCHSPDRGQEFFPDQPKEKNSTNIFGLPVMLLKSNVIEGNEKHKSIAVNSLASDYPCNNGKNIVKYLNTISVRKALHINEDVDAWDICNDYVFSNYKKQYKTMEPQYLKAVHRKLRILMYNGDIDMACNFLGDEWFVDSLGLSNPQERKMWHYKAADGSKQVAGFVKAFDYLTFVTIRGAGHQVPKEKPRQAYDMFRNFIQNKPF